MKWLDLVKDYECDILYHPGKANIVADALSRKTIHLPLKVKCLALVVTPAILEDIRVTQISTLASGKVIGIGSQIKIFYTPRCYQEVKVEHQIPYGKLQPLEIPIWKWEKITMDLITKLPRTPSQDDAI
ncbi:uncharacterized protein [Rutidosis leptorrhynchoides]|uniref:uncharacterized protein n=1 Tax=Rutidosis leptorrhynchoides TaxID=125765 RepID=UPI003A99B379